MNTLTRKTRGGDRAQTEQFVAPPASVIEGRWLHAGNRNARSKQGWTRHLG